MVNHRYRAIYGAATIEGDFLEVTDVLASRGFDMTAAMHVGPHAMHVPHPEHTAAMVERVPEVKSPEIIAAEHAYLAAMKGHRDPGLQTKDCGCVHPEGLICIVPVLYKPMCSHCQTDQVYAHEGPHEALIDGLVKFRWVETVQIEDLSYNAYGPMEEDE
jgi:hypothetical protein